MIVNMGKTFRYYNINKNYPYWHPYQVLCMGNCHFCKDIKKKQQEKTRKEKELLFESR